MSRVTCWIGTGEQHPGCPQVLSLTWQHHTVPRALQHPSAWNRGNLPQGGSKDMTMHSKCAGCSLAVGSRAQACSLPEGAGLQGRGYHTAWHSYQPQTGGFPPTGHVCTAANPCCCKGRCARPGCPTAFISSFESGCCVQLD